jgi:1,4-alpha-glucan branching enzyme
MDGERGYTGFKYWAVTGHTDEKSPYDPVRAGERAVENAAHFLKMRAAAARKATRVMDRPPLMVCPYDAELFGHWWFEGPAFIEALFKAACRGEDCTGDDETGGLSMVTLGEYYRKYPSNPISDPEFSSWGEGGYSEVWLDGSNDWVYRHTHRAIERMSELAERFPDESSLRERILNQGAREVMLAMCSDWSLLLRSGTSAGFAKTQVEDAISNFNRIYEMLCANTVATEWITKLEKRNNIFPEMNYRIFRRKR